MSNPPLDPDSRRLPRDEPEATAGDGEAPPGQPREAQPSPWEPAPPEPPREPRPPSPWDSDPQPSRWESERNTAPPWDPDAPPEAVTREPGYPRTTEPGREPPPWEPGPPSEGPPPEPEPEYHGWNPLIRLGVPQPWRTIIDWIVTIAGAVAIVLAIKAWVVNPYRIPSSSMEPTLHCARPGSLCTARFSDRVLACRFCYRFSDPKRGDIIVFNVPKGAEQACGAGGVFVKRIIGLPGERWQERDGYVYINGKRLVESYVKPERRDFNSWPARRIPKNSYFMMGDNRQSSCDSRRWGTVPRKNIIGKVFAIYWPPQRIRVM